MIDCIKDEKKQIVHYAMMIGYMLCVWASMQKRLEAILEYQEAEFFKLFEYAQGAADQWESHQSCLHEVEKAYLDRLCSTREKHDQENQFQEISLDIVLDRLRQAASQVVSRREENRREGRDCTERVYR